MSYTKEQRLANAAKAAERAVKAVEQAGLSGAATVEPSSVEPTTTEAQPQTEFKPESRNDPRRDAFAEIEAREERVRKEAETQPKPDASTAEVAPATAPEATAEAPQPALAAEAPAPVETVRVKVDGEEFDVPKAEVESAGGLTAYQKDRAADNRLKKNNEALAQVRQTQAQIAQWIQQQQPKQPTLTDDQFIQSKVDIIRFGTPEESTAALQEVLARNRVDPGQIIQQATLKMQQSMAVDNFKKEFQDVVTNPLLRKLAETLEQERIGSLAPNSDLATFYRQIGNEVRSVAGPRPSQPQPATPAGAVPAAPTSDSTSPASDKEARKASIVNLPTAAARAAVPEESKPETRDDILNQMRKSRGIPTG